MKYLNVSILLILTLNSHAQILPDSIIRTDDGVVIAQIFKYENRTSPHYEYRFYNNEGFYCISLYKDKDKNEGFWKIRKSRLYNNNRLSNPDKDIIFKADTFEVGFNNILINDSAVGFEEKFNNTVEYYYQAKDYRNDKILASYIDSIVNRYNLLIFDTIAKDVKSYDDEVEIFATYSTPLITDNCYYRIEKIIMKDVRISHRERRKLNGRLDFSIKAYRDGSIDVKRLSCLSKQTNFILDKNIVELKGIRIKTCRAIDICILLKGAFYIEL